jgi:anti-sigma regulatory factor (Ser/Thr protein kinase)
MDKGFTSYRIEERSYVSYVKRDIHQQVARARFSEGQAGEIDIIVSEMASNIVKHAGSGELLFRLQDEDDKSSTLEIVSIDNGPGIADTVRMLRDGVSTTQTLGHGLGSINRLSDTAQLYSLPGWGTILYAMIKTKKKTAQGRRNLNPDVRALCVAKPRETMCGDGYQVKRTGSKTMILFGDGLGHGAKAKEAMERAAGLFFESDETDPVAIIRQMHEDVRRTRGLVGTIAVCDSRTKEWHICGVGNILTRMYSGIEVTNYMPYNGTIGLNLPSSMNPSVLPLESNQYLIMCTDGIQSRWDPNRYPSILRYDNTLLAAAIYKDYNRGNDDASVLIAKAV